MEFDGHPKAGGNGSKGRRAREHISVCVYWYINLAGVHGELRGFSKAVTENEVSGRPVRNAGEVRLPDVSPTGFPYLINSLPT